MLVLGFEKVYVFDQENYPEYPCEYKQQNLLFRPQRLGISGIIIKILNRIYSFLLRIPSVKARFQSLGFSADQYYLSKRGFSGPFGIFQKPLKIEFPSSMKNAKLRENLLAEIEEIVRPQFELLLSQLDPHIQGHELNRLSKAYVRMLIDWFPIGFLESLTENLERVNASLNMDRIVAVIGHDAVSTLGYFVCAASRLAGKTVIGVQHGSGHYGYIEDLSAVGQFEYALYDKMITWGWMHIDPHFTQCETILLPCPKLSEQPLKANSLNSVKKIEVNVRDVLFLSNLFHRFPHASTCGQARVDFIDEITSSQENLLCAVKNAGLTIDHKPYSNKYVDLYPEHFRRLALAGGAKYRLLKSTQKGLSVDLIKTCRIVLWDQIGSGTLECFTSKVPAIVYWKRIYSREASWARELIADLERCGVVHTDAGKLAQEIKTYLADPEAWMTNKERKEAIQAFCHKFAFTDSHWYESWKHQFLQWVTASSSSRRI
jgi:putative transferase (TIGR04331 family)